MFNREVIRLRHIGVVFEGRKGPTWSGLDIYFVGRSGPLTCPAVIIILPESYHHFRHRKIFPSGWECNHEMIQIRIIPKHLATHNTCVAIIVIKARRPTPRDRFTRFGESCSSSWLERKLSNFTKSGPVCEVVPTKRETFWRAFINLRVS